MKVMKNEFEKCMEVATYVVEKMNQAGICDIDASIDVDLRGCYVWVTTNVEVDRKLEFTREEIAKVFGNSGSDYEDNTVSRRNSYETCKLQQIK
jgi:hypothetical protein